MKKYIMFFILIGLAGCGYRMQPLKPVRKHQADYYQTSEQVALRVTKLDKEDAADCFNGKKVPNSMVPLMITVKNNAENSIRFAARHIDLVLLDYHEVYDRMCRSEMGPWAFSRAVAIGSSVYAVTEAIKGKPDKAIAGFAGTNAALLTGDLTTMAAAHGNSKFALDLAHKILYDVTLWPGEKITKLVFADEKQFKKRFKVNLYKILKKSKKKPTDVARLIFEVKV